MKAKEVMARTGATRNKLTNWTHYLQRGRVGTGNHYDFNEAEVALIADAVKAARLWGKSAGPRVFIDRNRPLCRALDAPDDDVLCRGFE